MRGTDRFVPQSSPVHRGGWQTPSSSSSSSDGDEAPQLMVANVASHPADRYDLDMPELFDGGLQDLDIDPDPWTIAPGDVPGPVGPQVTDVATSMEPPRTEDAGTQVDPEIQAGPPGGVPALALADFVAANPGLGPTLIADWLAQRPVDERERQVLRWASEVAAHIERRTAENFVYGSLGVWHGHHSHRVVVSWIRQYYSTIANRPQ